SPKACHNFRTHMGAANSNHFLPQAGQAYRHYHKIALQIASECAKTAQALVQRPEFVVVAREGGVEALAYGAFGQHFLQDAWAMGHMWQRWGSPDRVAPFLDSVIVAITSGLIHGAQGVLQDAASWIPDLNAAYWDDALSAWQRGVAWRSDAYPQPQDGAGDLWLSLVEAPVSHFPAQRDQLHMCTAAGLRAIYAATGQIHGTLSPVNLAVEPTSAM